MAKALGISTSTLSLYENGKNSPKTATLEKIAAMLHVQVRDLYTEHFEGQTVVATDQQRSQEEDVILKMDEMIQFRRVVEAARSLYPVVNPDYKPLTEVFDTCEKMLLKLERQSKAIEKLQAKLDFASEIIQKGRNPE